MIEEKLDSAYAVRIPMSLHEKIVKLPLRERQKMALIVRQLLEHITDQPASPAA